MKGAQNLKKTASNAQTTLERTQIGDDIFYRISNVDHLRPFFMSVVSDSNHWMFISSNGGLTAGRKNANFSIFPYYTDDKITESADVTGSTTVIRLQTNDKVQLWEPFSDRKQGHFTISRNLYKNEYGNKILFEEVNHDLQLTFRYQWNTSNNYGFVRQASLLNEGSVPLTLDIIDGIRNIVPYGVGSDMQNRASNLVDAYKRSELDETSGLGIYALSAIIVDKAEPSEALKANVVWSIGLDNPIHLISAHQLQSFRDNQGIEQETDIKGKKGAYLLATTLNLAANGQQDWAVVANVNQNHAAVAQLRHVLQTDAGLYNKVLADIELGTKNLIDLNASSDGIQCTADPLRDTRHFANTLFNIMRGGIFDNNYLVERWDFAKYLQHANRQVYERFQGAIAKLSDTFTLSDIQQLAADHNDPDFRRLVIEYLPLKFSRRHGDPSRPWNKFSINTRSEIDGSKILDYEGNWRDIFQNWEALAYSFPGFMEGMILKFLNASTFDGYNPYRVTKGGFDWEIIEPDDPWSYIGYWGDHQIIYLLKFLEFIEKHQPGRLAEYFTEDLFVYAHVPYLIKSYKDILKDPKDTIDFDHVADTAIRARRDSLGADGALLQQNEEGVYRVNFIEKILASVLAKMSNFIPGGGIWMNTQRPEWNDANNALVGNGVSMVTLYYLRRFMKFFENLLESSSTVAAEISISKELLVFFAASNEALQSHQEGITSALSDENRKALMDKLGMAASAYRWTIYEHGFCGDKGVMPVSKLKQFTKVCLDYLEQSIDLNRRADNLYHAYNLMSSTDQGVSISHLSEMLEGQVAVLSAGYLSPDQVVAVLDGLQQSALYRKDQYSYILYPNKELPGFLQKNNLPHDLVQASPLLNKLLADHDSTIIEKDISGDYHFNGNFKNATDLSAALENLDKEKYGDLLSSDSEQILTLFETVFNHKEFTGRSGTFFGYEGLGSIYWHMVSKLLLAVQECCLQAIEQGAETKTIDRLVQHYYAINAGIGVHKSPELYGAFPTDPYSHTPTGKGAQQPGMTGQVKEDILSRFGELGVFVLDGQLHFAPTLLRKEEFLTTPTSFSYIDVHGKPQSLSLAVNSLGFTYCQIPVVYSIGQKASVEVSLSDGTTKLLTGTALTVAHSQQVFRRNGDITLIAVQVPSGQLR